MEEEIRKILDAHEERLAKLEALIAGEPKSSHVHPSAKDFIFKKKPKDEVQKVLALGYYLEKYERLPQVNLKDFENAFTAAKESIPENINYKVLRNIGKGHMMEVKERKDNLKCWSLTGEGERFVEDNFKVKSN